MKDKEKSKDFSVKTTTIQIMILTAIFIACVLCCRLSEDSGRELIDDYKRMTAEDMKYEDFKALFKGKKPAETDETTTDPDEEVTEDKKAAESEEITTDANALISDEDKTDEYLQISKTDSPAVMYLSAQLKSSPVFPVEGSISSSFGNRISPIYGYSENHKGADIAARQGTPIRAVMDGIVSMVDYTEGRGNFVILDHRDTKDEKIQTLYQHCKEILVKPGTVVRAGEAIALVGSTGDSTGPHLHLEYRVNGKCLDPITSLFGEDYAV